jgi:hypothetical protein
MAETKYTEERARVILDAIEEGASDNAAAGLAGITAQTYYNWIKAGKAGEEPFLTFLGLAQEAKSKRELRRVRLVENAAFRDWHAATWLLERSGNDAWLPPVARQKITQDVKTDGTVRIEYVNDWRRAGDSAADPAALPAPGPDPRPADGEAVQLARGGAEVAEDHAGDGDRRRGCDPG